MYEIDAVVHLGASGPGQGLADTEEFLINLLVDPFQVVDELVAKLTKPSISARGGKMRFTGCLTLTILKCTGGPPKDVKPRYQFSLIVFQNCPTSLLPLQSRRGRIPMMCNSE
jgi:hypothetical protein